MRCTEIRRIALTSLLRQARQDSAAGWLALTRGLTRARARLAACLRQALQIITGRRPQQTVPKARGFRPKADSNCAEGTKESARRHEASGRRPIQTVPKARVPPQAPWLAPRYVASRWRAVCSR